jgi:hypothetical protein
MSKQRNQILFVVALILCTSVLGRSQSLDTKAADKGPDSRSAREVFEDANGYLGRRYQEFNKKHQPYDPKLEAQVKKEQHRTRCGIQFGCRLHIVDYRRPVAISDV